MTRTMVHSLSLSALLGLVLFAPCEGQVLSNEETKFLAVPNATNAKENLRFITSMPHVAGTEQDFIMANFVKDKWTAAGIPHVEIDELEVYLTYPMAQPSLVMMDPDQESVLFQAQLSEDILEFDPTSNTIWRNHTFHGYSPAGDVTGEFIYAHYGRPQDFQALEDVGLDVEGKIVIVRYGHCFRGLKVMNAQKKGAAAVLIYSDPIDDGFSQGPVYPKGPWRPSFGVQRGSVQFNTLCAGDPMRADKRYGTMQQSVESLCGHNYTDLIPKIPSLPISYGDAKPLLEALSGPLVDDVFEDFTDGGLDTTYRVGPSTNILHLVVNNQGKLGKVPNVIGVIQGSLPPNQDQPVLLGNHRDAWVYGAADPNSGTACLLEVAEGLGKLVKSGWQPKRTIYLLSWSGEEYGLLGSTGWGELNADKIERAIAYFNLDTAVSGDSLEVALTPSLSNLWEQVLDDLHVSGHALPFKNGPHGHILDTNTNTLMNQNHPHEKTLGSGSDYTVFLDRFGISSVDFSFGKRSATYGQYHSIYDSFAWMDAYGGVDNEKGSSFSYMALAAKMWGLLALRLADGDLLSFNHINQGKALKKYLEAIRAQSIARPLDLGPLANAIEKYQKMASELHLECSSGKLQQSVCNEKLAFAERRFISEDGLPSRQWFRHVLQAPGLFLGYAAEAFPGVQQALDDEDVQLAQKQSNVAASCVDAAAEYLTPFCTNES